MREGLIEKLRSVKWEVTDDCDRTPDDPTHKCVFVDMRPDDFRALLGEAAAAIEALRAEVAEWKRVASAQAELHDESESRAERLAEALWELEERVQRDEALLRQALEALELRCGTNADERKELIPALRERLGEGAEQ